MEPLGDEAARLSRGRKRNEKFRDKGHVGLRELACWWWEIQDRGVNRWCDKERKESREGEGEGRKSWIPQDGNWWKVTLPPTEKKMTESGGSQCCLYQWANTFQFQRHNLNLAATGTRCDAAKAEGNEKSTVQPHCLDSSWLLIDGGKLEPEERMKKKYLALRTSFYGNLLRWRCFSSRAAAASGGLVFLLLSPFMVIIINLT